MCPSCGSKELHKISFIVYEEVRCSMYAINPLAYTDVPETAGLARSINP